MSAIKGKNTKPEMLVRSIVHNMGFRFRLHSNRLPGKPDLVLSKHRKVIFVNGCFWHGHEGCKRSIRPTTNTVFWDAKLGKNVRRDAERKVELALSGWQVLVVWQCETRNRESLVEKLSAFLYN